MTSGKICGCYVQHLDARVRFALRFGAHDLDCPAYRPSQDPVDHLHDEQERASWKFEVGERLRTYGAEIPRKLHAS